MSLFLTDITEPGVVSYHSCLCDSIRLCQQSEEQPMLENLSVNHFANSITWRVEFGRKEIW